MSAPFRRMAIERALSDWFRRDGWEISGGRASKALGIADDERGFFEEECSVDINDLSTELDEEFDRIGGAK